MSDLRDRLRAMYSHRGDGIPTQHVNPDGPEAADRILQLEALVLTQGREAASMAKHYMARIEQLEAERDRLRKLVDGRDRFIVDRGLWDEFTAAIDKELEQ